METEQMKEFQKQENADIIRQNINRVIVGRSEVIRLLLTALLAGGHVLMEDVPGTGKTMLAKTFAASIDGAFSRIQFTPDLLPSDVTGINYYDQKAGKFIFRKGPAFANILLADEINRATPRTQASLLECMEERQITVDGQTRSLEDPFMVIATQNPVETAGTFELPEAQLDRFLLKISMGYPDSREELAIIDRFLMENPLDIIASVCDRETILAMKKEVRKVNVCQALKEYIVAIVQATRQDERLLSGCSPRATISFVNAVRAYAYVSGRDYVVPEDIRALLIPVLAHRMIPQFSGTVVAENYSEKILTDIVQKIEVPTEDWRR